MWAEGVRELLVLLRPFRQAVYPAAQRRIRASEEMLFAVLHLSRQGLQHFYHMLG
jgi:hypothetical protein